MTWLSVNYCIRCLVAQRFVKSDTIVNGNSLCLKCLKELVDSRELQNIIPAEVEWLNV